MLQNLVVEQIVLHAEQLASFLGKVRILRERKEAGGFKMLVVACGGGGVAEMIT